VKKFKSKSMKHRVVTTEQGKVLVDESADIKGLYHDSFTNKLYQSNGAEYVKSEQVNNVVATINFSLDKDIPMVIVEDEVEKLALDFASNNSIYPSAEDDIFYGFVAGYKASQKLYSEEDLINLVAFICNEEDESGKTISESGEMPSLIVKQFVQSLKQEYIELDTMISFSMVSDNYGKEIIRTDLANRQLMAYVKNCKTQTNDNKTR
jgi:hypothetical protein